MVKFVDLRGMTSVLRLGLWLILAIFSVSLRAQTVNKAENPSPTSAAAPSANKQPPLLTPEEFPQISRLAVIDMQRAEQGTKIWKNYQQQAEVLVTAYQKDAKDVQQRLEDEKRDLDSQKSLLSPEAYNQRVAEFTRKAQLAQRNFTLKKQALDKVLGDARQVIQKVLNRVLLQIAIDYKFDVVLRRTSADQSVVVSRDLLEISPIVIDRVDKEITEVNVADPASINLENVSKP